MSEHKPLSAGRRLWVEQECQSMARVWREQDKTRKAARSDILYKLMEEMWNDGYNFLFYRIEIEAILDKELDNVYKGTTTH